VIVINVKYLGKYIIKWESGQVKAMRFYLEYINHSGRLQKKSAHRRLQAGFTITEVLLAGLMMLIAVLVAGNGLINLLRSNYRANADSEIQNNLNRTLEFVSDEVRRAKIIAENENEIRPTQPLNWEGMPGARAVLAFQIPDPSNPSYPLDRQILYYTRNPDPDEISLTGPRVLWRYGPQLDANGNYDTFNWQHSPVIDRLAAAVNDPICDDPTFTRIPQAGNVDDFYTCVPEGRNQVILHAKAQVRMTTNEELEYSVSTRVFPIPCQKFCDLDSPTYFYLTAATGAAPDKRHIPIVIVPATVNAEIIQGGTCTFSPSCGVLTAPKGDLGTEEPEGAFGSPVDAIPGDGIAVHVDGLHNVFGAQTRDVDVYTSDSRDSPRNLDNNQVLFVFTTKTTPPNSYQILVTIEPK
jgi:hypothetical protein